LPGAVDTLEKLSPPIYCQQGTEATGVIPLLKSENLTLINLSAGPVMLSITEVGLGETPSKEEIERAINILPPFPEYLLKVKIPTGVRRTPSSKLVFMLMASALIGLCIIRARQIYTERRVRDRQQLRLREQRLDYNRRAVRLDRIMADRREDGHQDENANAGPFDQEKYDRTIQKRALGGDHGPWGDKQ